MDCKKNPTKKATFSLTAAWVENAPKFDITLSVEGAANGRVFRRDIVMEQTCSRGRAKALHAEAKSVMAQTNSGLANMIENLSQHCWTSLSDQEIFRLQCATLWKNWKALEI